MRRLVPFLERARTAKGWSLSDLAQFSGVARVTIHRIECGKTDPRFESQLVPILTALGLDLADLYRKPQPKKGKP